MSVGPAFAASDSGAAASLASASLVSAGQTLQQSTIDALQAQMMTSQTTKFVNTMNASDAQSQQMLTYGVLLSRNDSLKTLADETTKSNLSVATGGTKDTYARQGEINEWQAQNKLDTLFFLQTLFIFFTFMVVMLYFRKAGTLTTVPFYIFLGVALLILIGILWNRASYTMNYRDQRYWNRRFVGLSDSGGLAAKAQCPT